MELQRSCKPAFVLDFDGSTPSERVEQAARKEGQASHSSFSGCTKKNLLRSTLKSFGFERG